MGTHEVRVAQMRVQHRDGTGTEIWRALCTCGAVCNTDTEAAATEIAVGHLQGAHGVTAPCTWRTFGPV